MVQKNNKIDLLDIKRPKLPFVMVTDASSLENEPIVEDHRLINWKRWLKRRQRQYQALDESGSRGKTEMIMNSCEKIRPKIEMRNLMEYATISGSLTSDKYRGNPGFWKLPPFLSSHGNFCSSEVGPVLTKKELNVPPILEYVDVPMSIREEKNLMNSSQEVPAWKQSSYLKEMQQDLADTIAILQPNTPETADLIALGQGFCHEEEYVTHVPVISITDTSLGQDDSEIKIPESPVSMGVVVTLKINDLEIRRDELSCKSSKIVFEEITWTLNFSSKMNHKSEKYLYFENTGTVAITYQWRDAISNPELSSLSSRNHSGFFFNKNKSIILPGQRVKFPVWFQQRKVGIFSESWCIETDPILSRKALIIKMCGYAACENFYTSHAGVDQYLDQYIQNTAIREIIDEIIQNGKAAGLSEVVYKSFYMARKLFRSKNPSYHYHPSLVTQFYHLYATAPAPHASLWTLSIVDLHHVLLQIKNPDLRHEKLKLFSDLCQQCLGICLFNPVRNMKYAMVYNILCALANRMEQESDFVKRNCILVNNHSATLTETRISSPPNSSLAVADVKPLPTTSNRTAITLYREVYYVRIYKLLVEAVEQACAIIDSLNNLNELE